MVALIKLAVDLFAQIIAFVFGLPVAVRQFDGVHAQRALALALDLPFEHEHPVQLFGAGFEQMLESDFDGALIPDIELAELPERLIVSGYCLVVRLQVESVHTLGLIVRA